ncbi:ABC transporter ATP-binding protein [Microbaculum marinisediminis]|uniref:ABC transporter ATP-binding protein n=1 Tax=Microbaculum marinisediminis TaxID=2931392 RepID=UPI003CC63025
MTTQTETAAPVRAPASGAGAAATRSIVSLRAINKTFSSGTVALKDMSLDVHPGEFISLLGPSGCGKSTALRLIAGLGEPTSGTIDWPGTAQDRPGQIDHEIGFVFQEPTLMPWATVFNNVWLPLRLKGQAKARVRDEVMNALEMVGLENFADAYPRELSGGMKMRVSIARALVTRPKLLLMDEPFAALDEITRFKLNNDLLHLWESFGWTVIFVTHSVFESVYLSNRIVVMAARPGRVVADIAIDAPYPREDDFRTSTVYNEHCREVSTALQDAMARKAEA